MEPVREAAALSPDLRPLDARERVTTTKGPFMNRIALPVAMLLALAAPSRPALADKPAPAATPAPATPAPRPMADLAWLVDGVWVADATKLGPGMLRIETRYRWSDNGAFIRFNTHFVTEKTALKTYDGNFWWDPATKGFAMWYVNAGNEITSGPVTRAGDDFTLDFHGPDMAGKPADLRVLMRRVNPDLYHWSLAEKVGETWKPLLALDYARKADS